MSTPLERVFRDEWGRVLATLIRVVGGFENAEEALHEAFAAAAEQWPRDGVPENPYAWLVSTGRFRLISRWRRQARLAQVLPALDAADEASAPVMPEVIQDDELRLVFICCHPALTPDARIALTLREVAGLTTEEIARAYLTPTPTVAQRIVRAKAKIREDALPYELPARAELLPRLESVLEVVYLIFNEGHTATEGPQLSRPDLHNVLAGQLVGGKALVDVRIKVRSRWSDVLITVLTAGLVVPRTVTASGIVVK